MCMAKLKMGLLVAVILMVRVAQADSGFVTQKLGADMAHPWGIAVLNQTEALVTLRAGALLRLNLETGEQQPIRPIPRVAGFRQGGMLDVAVLNEGSKAQVFLCYSKALEDGQAGLAIASGQLEGNRLKGLTDIFVSNHSSGSGIHFGCRLALNDRFLFASLGDRGDRDNSQNVKNHAGAILRIDLSASNSRANTRDDWLAELYSIGHRNPQGLAIQPETGALWAHEHGPRGGDEINLIEQNANYGWPLVSYGKEYIGGDIGLGYSVQGLTDPVWIWDPSIAPSGMLFYTGDMFAQWQSSLLIGALRFTSIYRLEFDAITNKPIKEERLFDGTFGRVRDIEQAQDGSLLVLSDAPDGGVYRISR